MNKITYANKVDTRVTADPEINKVTASTLNEIKTIANETIDQVEDNITEIALNTSKITDSGVPAVLSNGTTPTLNSGISATEIRTLIGAGTGDGTSNLVIGTTSSTAKAGNILTITTAQANEIIANNSKVGITSTQANDITANNSKVTDTGTPAILSNGTIPSLNSGISATEIRSLIGAKNITYSPTVTNQFGLSSTVINDSTCSVIGDIVTVNISFSTSFTGNDDVGIFKITSPFSKSYSGDLTIGSGSTDEFTNVIARMLDSDSGNKILVRVKSLGTPNNYTCSLTIIYKK